MDVTLKENNLKIDHLLKLLSQNQNKKSGNDSEQHEFKIPTASQKTGIL